MDCRFFATILISSVFALSLIAWFGNPIKSVIYKNALDEWIEINLDNNRFSVGEYKYDWYDGDFVYEIIDSQTGRQEYLKYKERKNRYDAIYSTWDEKVYVLPKK